MFDQFSDNLLEETFKARIRMWDRRLLKTSDSTRTVPFIPLIPGSSSSCDSFSGLALKQTVSR